jgi:NADPH2:quinone reductase
MTLDVPLTGLQLRSLVKSNATLELSIVSTTMPEPAADEVILRVEAAPINPSDLLLLFGFADLSTVKASGPASSPVVTASIPERAMKSLAGRVDQSMPVGNEGAGVVVRAGSSAAAQALLGRVVAVQGGGMYAQLRGVKAEACLAFPEGTTAAEAASSFINPLTALGMVETMRREQHSALVHTAAASNLGQMLNRLCLHDGIALVNIVRKDEQAATLRALGVVHVCNSSAPTFLHDLTEAIVATGATLAFDATGGGALAGQILSCMEAALNRNVKEYNRYGSATHKQVYLYGALDSSPTELLRNYGMAWGIGGWLMTHFIQKIGRPAAQALKERVAREVKTTFASTYSRQGALQEMLTVEAIEAFGRKATGEKYLVTPNVPTGLGSVSPDAK